MLFSSLQFLFLFLPLFFLCYFTVNSRSARNFLLFLFSLVFYAWGEPMYILLMLASLFLNYVLAMGVGAEQTKGKSGRFWLVLDIIVNLGLLGVFKYAGFVVESINAALGVELAVPGIVLPIGISFYTFQIMSYVIDVYRQKVAVQKNFVFLGAYLAAFPQLIAGPIVRYQTVAEELEFRSENTDDIADGIRRFIVGLGKKVLLANTLAFVVDNLYVKDSSSLGALGSWIMILSYAMQIYFDFSGYSDMAIGMGRMMGFHYLENFNYPYIASSVTDFWRRWHISLSTFFRDYVYIPLGGNRVKKGRWIFNVLVVWLLTGLWHGASWNFILWGVYFGVILLIEKLFLLDFFKKVPIVGHLFAGIVFIYGWVIFRCESISKIGEVTKALFGGYGLYQTGNGTEVLENSNVIAYILRNSGVNTVFAAVFIIGIIGCTPLVKRIGEKVTATAVGRVAKDVVLIAILLLCVCELAANAYNPFIYYRF
jgi:alginate O-acetyltransferase complex protein AlgI